MSELINRILLSHLTDAEKYERKKEQDRARQKTYYNRNKDIFTAKKREATVQIQQVRQQGHQLDFTAEPVVHLAPVEPVRQAPVRAEPVAPVAVPTRINTARTKLKGVAYTKILDNWKDDSPHTLKTNTTQLNGLYELLDTPKKQVLDLHQADYVIAKILNRGKANGDNYSTASNVKILQVLLKLVSPSNKSAPLIPIPADQVLKYKQKHDALDATVRGNTENKKQTEVIGDWDELVRQVLAKEGQTSKAYVYLTLYNLLKCRDDLQLMIVKTEAEANDKKINYIVVPEQVGTGLMILNHFKTDKGYDKKRVVMPPDVVQLVKGYGSYKGYGQFLFGAGKQANFVGSLLEKYGMKLQGGGVDLLRKMLRAKYMLNVKTMDDEVKLAYEFGHTLKTAQAVYAREQPSAPLVMETPMVPAKKLYDIRDVIKKVPKKGKGKK